MACIYQIQCCKDCTPPKRYIGCSTTCEDYKAEKVRIDELKRRKYEENKKFGMMREYKEHSTAFKNSDSYKSGKAKPKQR